MTEGVLLIEGFWKVRQGHPNKHPSKGHGDAFVLSHEASSLPGASIYQSTPRTASMDQNEPGPMQTPGRMAFTSVGILKLLIARAALTESADHCPSHISAPTDQLVHFAPFCRCPLAIAMHRRTVNRGQGKEAPGSLAGARNLDAALSRS